MISRKPSIARDVADGYGNIATPEELFRVHYRRLTRTVMMLVDDQSLAEEVVQDSFAEIVYRWNRIETSKARSYLYRTAMNRARSVLRRRRVARHTAIDPPRDAPSAEVGAVTAARDESIRNRIVALPSRQRRVLVLRFYSDLSVAEVAAVLGISRPAVASATRHALASLRRTTEDLR